MPDGTCHALKLLLEMSNAYIDSSNGNDRSAEAKLKPLIPRIISHLEDRTTKPPPGLDRLIESANKRYLLAKHSDPGSPNTFLFAIDDIKDALHRRPAMRRYFLGTAKYGVDIKQAMGALGSDDTYAAIETLDNISLKQGCKVR